jgi:hypothetical protein
MTTPSISTYPPRGLLRRPRAAPPGDHGDPRWLRHGSARPELGHPSLSPQPGDRPRQRGVLWGPLERSGDPGRPPGRAGGRPTDYALRGAVECPARFNAFNQLNTAFPNHLGVYARVRTPGPIPVADPVMLLSCPTSRPALPFATVAGASYPPTAELESTTGPAQMERWARNATSATRASSSTGSADAIRTTMWRAPAST